MAVDPLSQLTSRDVSVYSEYRDSKLVKSYCTGYTGLEQNWYVAFISKYFIKSTEQSDCMNFLVGKNGQSNLCPSFSSVHLFLDFNELGTPHANVF